MVVVSFCIILLHLQAGTEVSATDVPILLHLQAGTEVSATDVPTAERVVTSSVQ